MTSLRDPFTVVHQKDIKNKDGVVVAQVDYVGWSQSADRLDEAVPENWSFSIMAIGEDWVHGRLTIGDRSFENIGYAENAEATWKKEVLKDAASDAFKRCAALAGVARYLYDKDNHEPRQSSGRVSPARPPARSSTDLPSDLEEPEDLRAAFGGQAQAFDVEGTCPDHELPWTLRPGGVSKTTGKPYDAFWACPSTDRPYCKNKPSPAWQRQQAAA